MSRLDLYLNEISKMQRETDGWVLDGHIDGDALMFNSMLFAAQQLLIDDETRCSPDLWVSINRKGQVFRKPIESGNAYPTISKSEISRDMILGLVFGMELGNYHWRKGIIKMILSYSNSKLGILGRGLKSRTKMTPNLKTLLERLSDNKKWYHCYFPSIPMIGYQAHLDMLTIYLRFMTGHLGWFDKWRAAYYVRSQGKNVLFQIIHRVINKLDDVDFTIEMFENEQELSYYFPKNRLPTSHDRKTHYLWQRDMHSDDWLSERDEVKQVHVPFDYLIVMAMLKKHFPKVFLKYSVK